MQPSVSPLYLLVQPFVPHLPMVSGFHGAVSALAVPGWWGGGVLPYPLLSLGRQGGRKESCDRAMTARHGDMGGHEGLSQRQGQTSLLLLDPFQDAAHLFLSLTLCSQHEPSHCMSLEETSGRLRSSPPPACIFPCACALL